MQFTITVDRDPDDTEGDARTTWLICELFRNVLLEQSGTLTVDAERTDNDT